MYVRTLVLVLALAACKGADKDTEPTDTDIVDTDVEAPEFSIDLRLSEEFAEVDGDAITVTALLRGDGGVPVSGAELTLTVEPDTATFTGNQLVFHEDGLYTVSAVWADDSTITAEAGPVTVDSNGPVVDLISPERASWLTGGGDVTVSGTVSDTVSAVDALTLNGTALTVAADGSFSTTITPIDGLNVLSFLASDADGNDSDLIASFAHGDWLDLAETVSDGMQVRLNSSALDVVGSTLTTSLDPASLEAELLAANPVSSSAVGCVVIDVDANSLDFGDVRVQLTPDAGVLGFQIEVDDLLVTATADADLCSIGSASSPLTFTALLTTATGDVTVGVSPGGVLEADAQNVEVVFTDFQEDYGGLEDVLAAFNTDVAALGIDAQALLADQLALTLEEEIPAALLNALEATTFAEEFPILDVTATLAAAVEDVSIDPGGLTLSLGVDVPTPGHDPDVPTSPGSLVIDDASPVHPATPGVRASLSLDTFNRLLHASWDAGALNLDMDNDALGLPLPVVDLLFPGATTLDLAIRPKLAPFVTAGTGAATFDLHFGEMYIDASGLVDGVDSELGSFSLVADAPLEATLSPAGAIAITVGDVVATVDVVDPEPGDVATGEGQELAFEAVAGDLMTGIFPEFTLSVPDVAGFSVDAISVAADGADGTWVTVDAELVIVP